VFPKCSPAIQTSPNQSSLFRPVANPRCHRARSSTQYSLWSYIATKIDSRNSNRTAVHDLNLDYQTWQITSSDSEVPTWGHPTIRVSTLIIYKDDPSQRFRVSINAPPVHSSWPAPSWRESRGQNWDEEFLLHSSMGQLVCQVTSSIKWGHIWLSHAPFRAISLSHGQGRALTYNVTVEKPRDNLIRHPSLVAQ
jgi:hypothetical protein